MNYPIERGHEGERPRVLHTFAPESSTRTTCDMPTDNCVFWIRPADHLCPGCFPDEEGEDPNRYGGDW